MISFLTAKDAKEAQRAQRIYIQNVEHYNTAGRDVIYRVSGLRWKIKRRQVATYEGFRERRKNIFAET